jgi:DNA-binding GntR family transcriptional regulator
MDTSLPERTTMSPGQTAWGAYAQIAGALRQRIADEKPAPGSPLPSEGTLCKEFSVARNTIRRALALLENEELIETLPGKGRVVRGTSPTQYKHGRITADLRQQIERGDLAPGDVLPSENALIERYQVSRWTARHALATLETGGLIKTRHGKGRFVAKRP